MKYQSLADLGSDRRESRIGARHGFLEDHRKAVAAQGLQATFTGGDKVLAGEQNAA